MNNPFIVACGFVIFGLIFLIASIRILVAKSNEQSRKRYPLVVTAVIGITFVYIGVLSFVKASGMVSIGDNIMLSAFGIPFFVLGIFLLTIGARGISKNRSLMRDGVRADGIVVDVLSHMGSKGLVYAPQVEFHTASGRLVQIKNTVYSNRCSYKIGDSIPVIYSSDDETDAYINKSFDLNFTHGIFTIIGGVFVIMGLSFICKIF